ncbi:uncharacterized protein LTHEOB_5975 [Lasiodiplodia theobromae]|uniref:uncharacterized protein n=1 Tax=Lasiodiplodia theobromae TaxID=45133 RepID=UPI0015C3F804|nr:uncharacterized protein LTHEOB_5975 [Lasiodiplodia theobromae]KAF4544405.1 hypothetical protein LTHEOB_5975 [Lasiodiplodia theobromae]
MAVQDLRYDSYYDFIWYSDNGPWSVRFTAWYTIGLLKRNQGDDVLHAKAALRNILACQYTEEFDSAWYGTFKLSPDQPDPTPDSDLYPPEIYTTYDPNWREFIGTTLVQAVEEFEHLLGEDLVSAIETSLTHAAIGGMRRNGTYPEDDNLILGYSNPAYMRAVVVSWIGHRLNNSTFTDFANLQGKLLLELFTWNNSNTLGEYNAPTYYGMDIWALSAAIKYAPANSTIKSTSEYVLTELWKDIAAHYNPYLKNMVGPYDRAYTRDMTTHSSILSLWFWAIFGHARGPQPPKGEADLLYDVAQGAQIALVAHTTSSYIPPTLTAWLTGSAYTDAPRFLNRTIKEDLSSSYVRVATSWLSGPLMIGAESIAETANRGDQFVPAIVHWASDPAHQPAPYVGFFSLYPSASTVEAVAGERSLRIRYPNRTQEGTGVFTFAVSGVAPWWLLAGNRVEGLEKLPCLEVKVEAEGLERLPVTYGSQLRDHLFYNVSYVVPDGFEGVPEVGLEFEYTC